MHLFLYPVFRVVVSTSAVISDMEPEAEGKVAHGLGGVAGINEGVLWTISAQGVTNGAYGTSSNTANEYVGGIMGINYQSVRNLMHRSLLRLRFLAAKSEAI